MLTYILLGAVIGVFIGHLVPPGYFFWFIVGSICGYLTKHYLNHRY